MAATELVLANRPFAVEYFSDVMMPDGIFDTALYLQRITAFMRNTAGRDLVDVDVWLEGVSDPGIVPVGFTHRFDRIPAGAAVRVSWVADFRAGAPGKPFVSIMAREQGQHGNGGACGNEKGCHWNLRNRELCAQTRLAR